MKRMDCENCIHYHVCLKHEKCGYYEAQRPHGKWIDTRNFPVRWTCSECGRRDTHIYKFCPDCGAKMR